MNRFNLNDRVRIMMQGEDGMVWCEKNNVSREWAEENGDSLCFEYENAQWWIEREDAPFPHNAVPF